jgi:muramoyltetrapeptide carboxypeptidase
MLIRPRHLEPGATLGIIAPASAPPDPKNIDRAVAALEKLKFKIKLAKNVRQRHGFLAGSDRERAADLMQMFADRKVDGILCVRGGYGTARLLPLLDYAAIKRNAKVFIGYSDITSLHCAFLVKSNLISFHGPMLNSDFAHDNVPAFTAQSFLRTLMRPEPYGDIATGYDGKVKTLHGGVANGPLIGGNLSLLCTTVGTPWQPPFRDRILFFEDLDEVPYRMDRMLTQLLNAGLLQQVAGIAIGINKGCVDPQARKSKEYRQTLEDVFRERLLPLKIPVVMDLPFGHVPHNATLPIGAQVTLDATNGRLIVGEAGVA